MGGPLSSFLLTSARAKVHEACLFVLHGISTGGCIQSHLSQPVSLTQKGIMFIASRMGRHIESSILLKQKAPLWVQFYFTVGVLLVLLQVQALISMRHRHFGFVCSPFMTLWGPMVHPVKPREEAHSESDLPLCQHAKMF